MNTELERIKLLDYSNSVQMLQKAAIEKAKEERTELLVF